MRHVFVITDRVVNGWPVWAAVGGKWFMHRTTRGMTYITADSTCATGTDRCCIANAKPNAAGGAPTELPLSQWCSKASAALPTQYASARTPAGGGDLKHVPNMRITAVHGLADDDPAMAEALAKLAALA